MPSSIEGGLAQTLTRIDVQRGTDDIRVVIAGDGRLAHEVTRLDERRLMIDIPGVASAIRKPVISVNHQILKQVRLGYHADRVRVVLDLAEKAAYSVESQGANLVVTLREGAATDTGSGSHLNSGEALETIESENPAMSPVHSDATSRLAQWTMAKVRRASTKFHVRPVQLTSEANGGEKTTPKEDLVVGETRYIGRRISLDFQQADISNVLRLIAEVSGFNMVIGEGVKSKVTMKLVSVPWDQALDMILKMNGLGKIRQSNILWIDSLANIAKQQNEQAQAQDAKDQCTADGTDSAQCDSLAQGMLDECQQSCGTAPDQTCSEQCEQAARKRHDTVLHTTRNQTRATRRGQRVFRRCSRTCD